MYIYNYSDFLVAIPVSSGDVVFRIKCSSASSWLDSTHNVKPWLNFPSKRNQYNYLKGQKGKGMGGSHPTNLHDLDPFKLYKIKIHSNFVDHRKSYIRNLI